MPIGSSDHRRALQHLVEGDAAFSAPTGRTGGRRVDELARVSALIALHGHVPLVRAVRRARAAGASSGELMAALGAISTTVGAARVVSAAPAMARGMGFDIDDELEH